ncbi:unnamed protein product, partial [Didymodactylos carnosus]
MTDNHTKSFHINIDTPNNEIFTTIVNETNINEISIKEFNNETYISNSHNHEIDGIVMAGIIKGIRDEFYEFKFNSTKFQTDKKICRLIEKVLKEGGNLKSDHQLYRVCLMYKNEIVDDNTYEERLIEKFPNCLTEQAILYMIIFPSKLPGFQLKSSSKAFIPILDESYINHKNWIKIKQI